MPAKWKRERKRAAELNKLGDSFSERDKHTHRHTPTHSLAHTFTHWHAKSELFSATHKLRGNCCSPFGETAPFYAHLHSIFKDNHLAETRPRILVVIARFVSDKFNCSRQSRLNYLIPARASRIVVAEEGKEKIQNTLREYLKNAKIGLHLVGQAVHEI